MYDFTTHVSSQIDSMSSQLPDSCSGLSEQMTSLEVRITSLEVKMEGFFEMVGHQSRGICQELSTHCSAITCKIDDLTTQVAADNKDFSNMLDQLEILMSQKFGVQLERRL